MYNFLLEYIIISYYYVILLLYCSRTNIALALSRILKYYKCRIHSLAKNSLYTRHCFASGALIKIYKLLQVDFTQPLYEAQSLLWQPLYSFSPGSSAERSSIISTQDISWGHTEGSLQGPNFQLIHFFPKKILFKSDMNIKFYCSNISKHTKKY